jgi:hypothetical protein
MQLAVRSIVIGLLAGCAGGRAASKEPTPQAPADLPSELAVPAGNELAFSLSAEGAQIYDCKAGADGTFAWTLRAPRAELRDASGASAGTHYAGPTWRASDGSTVVAKRLASVSVTADAIPWLLLQASEHRGDGRMAKVTYVQRVHTRGGNAPTEGCDAQHADAVAEVEYGAHYAFYR